MRQTRLQAPPKLEDFSLHEWLRKAREAIEELQTLSSENDVVVIEQNRGSWSVEGTGTDGPRLTMNSTASRVVAIAPFAVGMQLTSLEIFGESPASNIREIFVKLTETLDENYSATREHARKIASLKAGEPWSVSFAGSDSGLPRRSRLGRNLSVDLTGDNSVGTSSFVDLIRWTFRKSVETDSRHTVGRRP